MQFLNRISSADFIIAADLLITNYWNNVKTGKIDLNIFNINLHIILFLVEHNRLAFLVWLCGFCSPKLTEWPS